MIQSRITLGLFGPAKRVTDMLKHLTAISINHHHFIHVTGEEHLRGRMFDGYILMKGATKRDCDLMESPEAALRLREK